MNNFTFQNTTKIIFGKGTENTVGEETAKYSKKVLLHYGGGSIKKTGLYDRVTKSLKDAGVEYVELGGVKPNPRLSLIYEGIELCRNNGIDFILAVGGGSVIDSAKGIAAGMCYEGDVWDLYLRKGTAAKALPVGVVLTIPAAGSESSGSSVVTKEEGQLKRDIGYDFLRPRFSILNPEVCFTLPSYQTACGAADIMAHIMERYFTNTPNVELTDRLSEATMTTMINNVPAALAAPNDYNAFAEIMWAGTFAHNDLLGTGREQDWSSHKIEHELSGIYDIAHGAGLAIIFPAWMKYVYKVNVNRFVQFAVRVWKVEQDFSDPEKTALEGIAKLEDFFRSLGLPTRLADAGITEDRFEEMAEKCVGSGTIGGLKKLDKNDIVNIYRLAR
ncbi:MAG: iron-containing alcohol dehydrogenase [Clostridiaceae bacterium]|nr:iron-containing alcohol dehydrogenase [Clostridiaceae bacterium]